MATQERQGAVPESGNQDGEKQFFDSELDSDDEVQETADGGPNPTSEEGTSVSRRIAFEEMLIIWTFKRKNLAAEHHKVMVTGYETTIGDIRMCLSSFGKQCEREMKNSAFKHYMKLPDTVTRSGKALHFMISRQVTPKPELDQTALWFKVQGRVLRFSRVEFALITGLKFGPAKINPYMLREKVSDNSVYARLLGGKAISPADLRTQFINKQFKVNKVVVKGTENEYLKVAKVLMASMFVVGLDTNKTKIPTWMWVLVEDDEAWEQFPWGSMAYQFLIGQINAVKKDVPGPYHLKGNTIAFLAWIYEVIPSYGLKIGGRVEQERRPRMLRYRYSMASEFPKILSKELQGVLVPTEMELTTDYWKSLEDDPETKPFAFQFEANHSKKKRKRSESEDEEEVVPDVDASTSSATAKLVLPDIPIGPDRAAFIKEIGDFVGDIAAKRARVEVEAILRSHEERIITSVGDYVVNRLLAMERCTAGQPTTSVAGGSGLGGAAGSELGGAAGSGLGGAAGRGHDGELGFKEFGGSAGTDGQPTIIGEADTEGHPTIKTATTDKATCEGMLVPSDTQINAVYDKFVCLGEVTPPVQGILPYASATAGAVEQPMNEKATRQEMLDPSDTQMNKMFDDLVCLGELTAPAQGILACVGGATGGLEQGDVQMYVDATPPVQSIIPYAGESSSHSALQTMAGQAITKMILNVRPIRKRFPARAIRSPFLHDEIRGGDTFDEYLKLEDGGMRNVGQPCGVDKTFFEEIMQPNKQLHVEHIESYMSILSSRPDLAGLNEVHSKIGLMSSYFMETVEEVFDGMHRGMREVFQRYDHKLFDPLVEEVIPVEEMDRLCLFAEAVQPNWGENMKQWIDCDKVVTVCNYNDHWGTLLLDLKRQTIWLYDSMAWKFDYHHVSNRRDVFLPMTRIVPQILKRIGYYELHRVKKPRLAQWDLCFPSPKKNTYKQNDSTNCGLYALKYVEHLISRTSLPKSLKTERDLIMYRAHIARTIYAHSTVEPLVPIPMELL
ncbi:hypothetical protein OROMI_033717 [Orobanche minor]